MMPGNQEEIETKIKKITFVFLRRYSVQEKETQDKKLSTTLQENNGYGTMIKDFSSIGGNTKIK